MGRFASCAARPWVLRLAPVLASAGCQLAPAKVWNLEQLHHPDGQARSRGRLESDFSFLFRNFAEATNFGGEEFRARAGADKAIPDPLGSCFENVRALGRCARDERVAGLQAATFAWLAVDCSYALSREHCVLALGTLGAELGLPEGAGAAPQSPAPVEALQAALEELLAALRAALPDPALAGRSVAEAVERARALDLDRSGACRLLRATNALLAADEEGPLLAPLRALRLELARRATALALVEAREDPSGRVRAAALEAGLRAFPEERAALLSWALTAAMPNVEERAAVSLRALEFLARYGLPPAAAGEDAAASARGWRSVLEQIVRLQIDGPNTSAACRALARITGEGATLRPEVWLARARERAGGSGGGAR